MRRFVLKLTLVVGIIATTGASGHARFCSVKNEFRSIERNDIHRAASLVFGSDRFSRFQRLDRNEVFFINNILDRQWRDLRFDPVTGAILNGDERLRFRGYDVRFINNRFYLTSNIRAYAVDDFGRIILRRRLRSFRHTFTY